MSLIKEAVTTAERVFCDHSNFARDITNFKSINLLYDIIVKEDIMLESHNFKNNNLCGMLIIDEYEKTLVYNRNHHPERRNFTIAHELGHFYLHREKQCQFADRTKDMKNNTLNEFEMQANAFAAQILLPNFVIFNLISQGMHFFQIQKQVQISGIALYWRLVNYLIDKHGFSNYKAREIVTEFHNFSKGSINNYIHHKCATFYNIVLNTKRHPLLSNFSDIRIG